MPYSLVTSYVGESLLSGFNWFNDRDLSNGFVSYQSRSQAQDMGLYSVDEHTGAVRLGVDSRNKVPLTQGRPSIRLESKQAYNHGLFIADFLHMPPSQCGLWPAFWAFGGPWPQGGEIDIIEGVNTATENVLSAHTSDGCYLDGSEWGLYSGSPRTTSCAVGTDNIGCGYDPPAYDGTTYGDGFNAVGGGVYAMLWDSEHIRVWHFPRGGIPEDIEAKDPQPTSWGLPQAVWGGSSCDIDSYFRNMNLVININFCGDYGNAVWGRGDSCNQYADTCPEFVANNPRAFRDAYWDISYIDVYDTAKGKPEKPGKPDRHGNGKGHNDDKIGAQEDKGHDEKEHHGDKEHDDKTQHEEGWGPAKGEGKPDWEDLKSNGPLTPPTESTTTTTKVFTSTETITVYPDGSRASPPLPTGKLTAPSKIGKYTHLGCFGSKKGFPGFTLAKDSKDMTLEQCVSICGTQGYAGIFQGLCYCGSTLDADPKPKDDELCDHSCPGNVNEACGGLISISGSASDPSKPDHKEHDKRELPDHAFSNVLLTVYGIVKDKKPHDHHPPALGDASKLPSTATAYNEMPYENWHHGHSGHGKTVEEWEHQEHWHHEEHWEHKVKSGPLDGKKLKPVVTTVHYETFHQEKGGRGGKLKHAEYVHTIEGCECEEGAVPTCTYQVPMKTHVVECDACGHAGESRVTLTEPAVLPTIPPPAIVADPVLPTGLAKPPHVEEKLPQPLEDAHIQVPGQAAQVWAEAHAEAHAEAGASPQAGASAEADAKAKAQAEAKAHTGGSPASGASAPAEANANAKAPGGSDSQHASTAQTIQNAQIVHAEQKAPNVLSKVNGTGVVVVAASPGRISVSSVTALLGFGVMVMMAL